VTFCQLSRSYEQIVCLLHREVENVHVTGKCAERHTYVCTHTHTHTHTHTDQEERNNEEQRNTRNATFTLYNLHKALRWVPQELLGRRGNGVCVWGGCSIGRQVGAAERYLTMLLTVHAESCRCAEGPCDDSSHCYVPRTTAYLHGHHAGWYRLVQQVFDSKPGNANWDLPLSLAKWWDCIL
jgi:hypothetical protein